MAFKPKSKDNLKDKKRYRAANRYYKKHIAKKSEYYKIWKKEEAQICKNRAVNGQQKFGKEKKIIETKQT
jgi:hypothetical protein